jgi:hypothetical protein
VKFYLQSPLRFTGVVCFFTFTCATTLCVVWSPPWCHNCIIFRDLIVIPKPNPQPVGPETTLRFALDLSGMGGPTSSLRSRQHSSPNHGVLKSLLHDKTVVLEEVKVEGKVVPVLNSALRHEGVWGSGCIDPHFLDLGTSWRWVVSFTPLPLYPRGKSPRYPLDRRLGGPQSQSGRRGEVKILALTGTRTPTPWSTSP